MDRRAIGILIVAAALVAPALRGSAQTGGGASLTGIRSWASPTNSRIVLDFSEVVSTVSPDSGNARELVVTVPGRLALGEGVERVLRVTDGVVDSVSIVTSQTGTRFVVTLHQAADFRVFPLLPDGDKSFRVVVDVTRPGGVAAEQQRFERIAEISRRDRVRLVAVDAGHGGEDVGARGPNRVYEKHVTLAIARALVEQLNAIDGVRAELTRDGDYFIPLRDRYLKAERMDADLFISIHANSSRRRGRGSGSEVYFLSLRGASDQADADLADIENAADLVGGIPPQAENDLVSILYDVKRSSALQQSQLLAESVLDQIAEDRRLASRGVKQAGFVVLKSVEFPSVLVETAFINNPTEARLLRDPDGPPDRLRREGLLQAGRRAPRGVRRHGIEHHRQRDPLNPAAGRVRTPRQPIG